MTPIAAPDLAARTDPSVVALADIEDAARALHGQIERTPLRKSRTLSQITGADIWIKFENLQFTASFKERGAFNKLRQLTAQEREAGVIAMSAGNHAQGVAYHAQRLGIPATIVMPLATPFIKVEHTRAHGARVVLFGETLADSSGHAMEIQAREGLTFVHPYDDPAVIAGQGTVGLEMIEDGPTYDCLLVPVGGGGLISGIATAVKARSPSTEIIGVETRMYPSLYAELRGDEAVCGGHTIAEGIAVKTAGRLPLAIARAKVDDVVLVDESHIERAIALFANVEKTVAEGAGAAGLAAILAFPERFRGKTVGLVLCGGNIDTRLLASVLMRALVREHRLARITFASDDRPGTLAKVTKVIGEFGGNIIEVEHNRLALDIPAKGAEFEFLIETRDAAHTKEIVDALRAKGFVARKSAERP